MPISTRFLVGSTSAFLLIGFMALLAIVAANVWLGERAQSYFDDAIAARNTRVAAVELRNAMQTAESSQRGFIITGNEIYLAPYQAARIQAQRHLSALQTLLPSYPNSELLVARLIAIVGTRFDDLDHTIALKRDQRDEDTLAAFQTNSGKALTDESNVFFSGIIGKADSRLTSGVVEQRRNTRWLRLVSAIGALVIVAVVGNVATLITRYTRALRATRDQINALNGDLEQRVAIRTADLAQARDRAELLLSEVNHRVANSLTLVSSLVKLQSKSLVDSAAKEALAETHDRILAISLVHRRLYGSDKVRSVALDEYLSGLLDHLRDTMRSQDRGMTLLHEVEPVELETDASVNLGVVVTELVTNAFKYAYPDGVGEIRVRLRKLPDDMAELVVEDDGIGRAEGAPAKGSGVGTRIVNAMCETLDTRIHYRPQPSGTAAHLIFSFKPRRAVAAG